jgi:GNAT superfamily N-acetyltransferase
MSADDPSRQSYRRELEDGLVLRWSTADDADRIAQLFGQVFRDRPDEPPNPSIPIWARHMMSGRHPLITPHDFALVEDTRTGAVVAATCLLAQAWEYAGIRFTIGKPEVVATDPAYRRRGLIRAVFELIHARSASRGHLAQGIGGIPYFYRQFGYEYALALGGGRGVSFGAIPSLKQGFTEPFRLRDADLTDLPQAVALYDRERAPALVSTPIEERYWAWVLNEADPRAASWWRTQMIVDGDGRAIGCVLTGHMRWAGAIRVQGLAVEQGVSLIAVLPSVLRALRVQAADLPAVRPDAPPADRISFALGREHPVYDIVDATMAAVTVRPYAWYVRVPDLPALIRHLAPALERRLATSAASGHSGELKLDFYRGGLSLALEQGRLVSAEEWRMPEWGKADAGFPPGVFLQLLFGHRSLDELRDAFPDAWAEDEPAAVLKALFPARPSFARELD